MCATNMHLSVEVVTPFTVTGLLLVVELFVASEVSTGDAGHPRIAVMMASVEVSVGAVSPDCAIL